MSAGTGMGAADDVVDIGADVDDDDDEDIADDALDFSDWRSASVGVPNCEAVSRPSCVADEDMVEGDDDGAGDADNCDASEDSSGGVEDGNGADMVLPSDSSVDESSGVRPPPLYVNWNE